jgi:glycosyltransferase involved in cell wall biosynthesis
LLSSAAGGILHENDGDAGCSELENAVRISVVVPAFNEEKLIGATLAAIREAMGAFADAGWETELIVCDNNSSDRTAELAKAAGATVVFEPVNQIGRARNTGAAAASGDWLLFVDADSKPSRELFADVARTIKSGRFLAGGTTVKFETFHLVAGLLVEVWNCVSRTFKYVAGSFIFVETSAFREIGGFSPAFFAGEEIDLSQRLKPLARARGRKLVILHTHPLRTSARKLHLYSPWDHIGFITRMVWSRQRTLGNRESCQPWYDGRR